MLTVLFLLDSKKVTAVYVITFEPIIARCPALYVIGVQL